MRGAIGFVHSELLDELSGFLISRVLFSGMKGSAWEAWILVDFEIDDFLKSEFSFLINGELLREEFGIIQSTLLYLLAGFLSSGMIEPFWRALVEVSCSGSWL